MTRYLSVLMLLVAGQNVVGQAADECAFSEPEKLTASDGNPYDYFGESVSISGETMVIGARGRDLPDPGGAYIFERDGLGNWNEVQKLTASDGGEWHEFGRSVSISGDYVLIGAPRDYDNGEDSGSAYVFERDRDGNWNEVQKLTASDGAAEDYFGWSVSISGDDAVIGALGDDDNGGPGGQVGAGGAYIFERDGDGNWNEVQKLTASDGGEWHEFGRSVSISGDYVLIGAPRDYDNGSYSGSAYIFERDRDGNWSEVQKLTAFDGASHDSFGMSVSISGEYAVIGAYGDDDNGSNSGSAYVFERDGAGNWSERAKLIASDGNTFDYFGISVSISGDYAVIGASVPWYLSSSGSAYVFERDRAGNWSEAQKVTASDGAELDSFGYSVSISGETMVIGAYGDDDNGSGSGSAYAFKLGLEDKLTASDGSAGDVFGASVSISGETMVIGAYGDDDNGSVSGSAYVFERDGFGNWSEVQKLTASDGGLGFGYFVFISGDYAVVGAYYDDDNGSASGSAYVFERDGAGNWSERAKLTASDGAYQDYFGISVSISGDYAVVGAYRDDDNGSVSGSAYVFERDGAGNWSERAKLTAFDGAEGDWFGSSVSISGEYAVIGAYRDDDNGSSSGSAYVFERDGAGNWSERAKLTAFDGAEGDWFGSSVSISGSYALIGALGDDDNGSFSGSAYIFERDGLGNWNEGQKLTASDGAADDWFGNSVSISGDYAMIGAYGDDDNGSKTGSAYVFERDGAGVWSETGKLTACDGAGGDYFGSRVSISGEYAVIGAPLDYNYDNGINSGSAYVYKIQPGPVCLGDTNGDLIVNLVDFTQLMVDYGTTGESAADFNGDNIVDLADFSILLVNYGNSCNAPLRAAPAGGSRSLAGSKAIGSSTR